MRDVTNQTIHDTRYMKNLYYVTFEYRVFFYSLFEKEM